MIRRHNRCRGIRLWKWGRFQIEVWFCPKGEVIETHAHQHIDSKIIVLYGGMWGSIGNRVGSPRRFKAFEVPAGVRHGAAISDYQCCIFANVERWKNGVDVTSAAEDFTAP